MPACVHGWSPLGACSICTPPEPKLAMLPDAAPGGVPLNDAERRYLAMHARYQSGRQDDVRYWDPDPEVRADLRRRWREIADWLHPDPWGPLPPVDFAVLAEVDAGAVMAVNDHSGSKRVRVIRAAAGEQPLVDCPDCGRAAGVGETGYIRCGVIPPCPGGWRAPLVQAVEA